MPPFLRARVAVLLAAFGLIVVGPRAGQAQRISATVDSTESVIDYTGSATMHDWTGTSRDVSGTMTLDLDAPDSSRVVVRAPVASFGSGRDRRDRKMREVTEATAYPTVAFRATDIRPAQWGRDGTGHAGRWRVTGALTFHGQTHPVEAVVDVRATDDSVHARAQFPVSLTRFGVERPELLWVPIGDTIRIDARIVGAVDTAPSRPTDAATGRRPDGPLLASAAARSGVPDGPRASAAGRVPEPPSDSADGESGPDAPADTTRLYADPMPFSGWKVINLPTDRTLQGGNWLFLISHRFSRAVGEGYSAFYGLDGPAIMYLSMGYALTDAWLVALARSNADDNVELETRYRILDESGPGPLGLSVQATGNWLSEDRPNESRWRAAAFKGTAQVTLTRTMADRLGLAVVPGLTLNPDERTDGEAPLVTLGLGARWKVQEKVALVGEWTPILARSNRTVTAANRYGTWSAGVEITTEGHVFQVVATNNAGLTTDQYLGGGDFAPGDVLDGRFRLGFNIFRVLDFSKF